MANWKKVVVSGSSPEFSNLQVDGLTASEVVIGGGSAGNLSTTAINGTGNIVATTGASNLVHSGSFSGSFEGSFSGDGTNLTGITAEWDGTMFVGNVSGLASAQITGSGAAPSLILSGSTGNDLVVENNAEIKGNTKLGNALTDTTEVTGSLNLSGSFNLIKSSSNAGFQVKAGSWEDIGVAGGYSNKDKRAGILLGPLPGNSNNSGIFLASNTNQTVAAFMQNNSANGAIIDLRENGSSTVNLHSGYGSYFKNNLAIGIDVADMDYTASIAGNAKITKGLTVSGSTALNVTGSTNLTGEFTGTADTKYAFGFKGLTKEINLESGVLEIKGHTSGQTLVQFRNGNNNLLGEFNNQSDGLNLRIMDDGSNSINFSAAGTNGSYHNPNLHIGATAVQSDAKLKVTGNILATTGITSSNLTNDNLLVAGANGEIESSGVTFNGSALDLGSSNITTTGNGTFGGDVTISGDLAVAGTASFTHASNLDVADKYILLNSGSVGNSDSGGIVIQGPGQDIGDLFGYRSGSAKSDTVQRWGIASGFDAKTSADFTPSAFMAAVVVGTGDDPAVAGADYAQAGNMYIDTDAGYDGIWIYS